jgi:hypothetical protein
MAVVMIGLDPHKASHTAVAISAAEEPPGQLRVLASAVQAERLLEWAQAWPERAWAVEGAGGLGHLLAQQLLSAGERVLHAESLKRLGDKPVVIEFASGGAKIEVAGRAEHRALVTGPMTTSPTPAPR